jgi:hypothetical protein
MTGTASGTGRTVSRFRPVNLAASTKPAPHVA